MPDDQTKYISCDDIYKILSEMKHDHDLQATSLAAFIEETKINVIQYKSERDNLNLKLDESQKSLNSHIISERPKLYAIQTKLNLALALVISACLFGLAGPNGLRQIGDFVGGSGIGADGVIALLGFGIPLLVPLGNRLFVRVVDANSDRNSAVVSRE